MSITAPTTSRAWVPQGTLFAQSGAKHSPRRFRLGGPKGLLRHFQCKKSDSSFFFRHLWRQICHSEGSRQKRSPFVFLVLPRNSIVMFLIEPLVSGHVLWRKFCVSQHLIETLVRWSIIEISLWKAFWGSIFRARKITSQNSFWQLSGNLIWRNETLKPMDAPKWFGNVNHDLNFLTFGACSCLRGFRMRKKISCRRSKRCQQKDFWLLHW